MNFLIKRTVSAPVMMYFWCTNVHICTHVFHAYYAYDWECEGLRVFYLIGDRGRMEIIEGEIIFTIRDANHMFYPIDELQSLLHLLDPQPSYPPTQVFTTL